MTILRTVTQAPMSLQDAIERTRALRAELHFYAVSRRQAGFHRAPHAYERDAEALGKCLEALAEHASNGGELLRELGVI